MLEADRRMLEADRRMLEADRRMLEADRRMLEADRRMLEADRQIRGFGVLCRALTLHGRHNRRVQTARGTGVPL